VGLFGRWHKGDALIDTLIVPPVYRFAGADEALARQAQQRRDAAASMRHRAAAVETGAPTATVLRLAPDHHVRKDR
jgi:hypothetical protein